MDAKLTLKLNEAVIARAKHYAADRKLSLSKLVENYLDSLTSGKEDNFQISPFVKSFATGKSVPLDAELKRDYADHLESKYS